VRDDDQLSMAGEHVQIVPFCAPPTDQTEGIIPVQAVRVRVATATRPRTVIGIRSDARTPRAAATPCRAAWGLGSCPR